MPLQNSLVCWPGDPLFNIQQIPDQADEEKLNISTISMGLHTGTHIDAPLHCLHAGKSIEDMPLDATVGQARVIEINNVHVIEPEHLISERILPGQRILFKTCNSLHQWHARKFTREYCHISRQAADFLVKNRIRSVGIDYLSVGEIQDEGLETHRILLNGGVWIIEGLNLTSIQPGRYQLICLPLRIRGGDGAPARAIIKPLFKQT